MKKQIVQSEFRKWVARFAPGFVMALIASSLIHGQDVKTNYLPNTDFSKYRTYNWVTIGGLPHPDQILDAEIKQSIDSQLVGKGFTKIDSSTPGSAHTADFPKPPDL